MFEIIRKTWFAIQTIGLKITINSLRYTRKRDQIEKRYRSSIQKPSGNPLKPGHIQEIKETDSGAHIRMENGIKLEIHFLSDDMLRITWLPGQLPPSYALAQQQWEPAQVNLTENVDSWRLRSSKLEIEIHPCGTLYYGVDGKALRIEAPPTLDGSQWTHTANLTPDAALYGLGEKAAWLNLRGGTYRQWNSDPAGSYTLGNDPLYANIPVYFCLSQQGGYLVFYENSHDGDISFSDSAKAVFKGGALRQYFVPGTPAQALSAYTHLTGRPPLPPRWALGFHQSRWGYESADEVREIVAGFNKHNLPLDAFHLDIDYMHGFRVFTTHPVRFSNLKSISAELEQQGIKTVTIIDPAVKQDPGYDVHDSGLDENVFCSHPDGKPMVGLVWPNWSLFPDFTNPKTRAWWGQFYSRLLDSGVDGIWHDMNEPASFAAFGDGSLPRPTRHDLDGQSGDHEQAHNLYGLTMNQSGFDALRQHRPDRRPWLLTRSGWAGMQRYAWKWTGDVESTWKALKMTISSVVGSGLSGIAYNGSDIGGFSGNPDAELYTRWFQMGALMPFFRNHAAKPTPPREPWVYGEPTTSIIRQYLNLRHSLIPYLYTLAWQANQNGYPLARPIFWGHHQDQRLWNIDDTFLLGDHLLVAPVYQPGMTQREIILPEGLWHDFWNDRTYSGGKAITVNTPLEEMPIFVRGGAVLPMQCESKTITLHLYAPAQDSLPVTSWRFDDDGDGYGDSRLDTFTFAWEDHTLTLHHKSSGDYPLPESFEIDIHGLIGQEINIDGNSSPWQAQFKVNTKFNKMRFGKCRLPSNHHRNTNPSSRI